MSCVSYCIGNVGAESSYTCIFNESFLIQDCDVHDFKLPQISFISFTQVQLPYCTSFETFKLTIWSKAEHNR